MQYSVKVQRAVGKDRHSACTCARRVRLGVAGPWVRVPILTFDPIVAASLFAD